MGEAVEVKISKEDERDLAPFIDPTPRKTGCTLGELIQRRTAGLSFFEVYRFKNLINSFQAKLIYYVEKMLEKNKIFFNLNNIYT